MHVSISVSKENYSVDLNDFPFFLFCTKSCSSLYMISPSRIMVCLSVYAARQLNIHRKNISHKCYSRVDNPSNVDLALYLFAAKRKHRFKGIQRVSLYSINYISFCRVSFSFDKNAFDGVRSL